MIEEAVKAPNEMGLTYVPDFKQFEHLRIYARGYTQIARVFRGPKTKFRKRTMLLDAYQRLIIVLKFREGVDFGPYHPLGRSLPADVQGRPSRRYGDAPP